ncbi:hypothetical protein [Cupriavidus sp.]|uniref:hypothetical protein n=1 Tax=Cupriavidus sp. TaxID=1873897 RepID=UPI000FBBF466|nr:hypothetical protein [Cupriavidus sp.]
MTVQTKSEAINRAIQLAAAKGYQVKEISDGYSGAEQVVYMAGRLTGSLRAEIETGIPELRYRKSERTPQNPRMRVLSPPHPSSACPFRPRAAGLHPAKSRH